MGVGNLNSGPHACGLCMTDHGLVSLKCVPLQKSTDCWLLFSVEFGDRSQLNDGFRWGRGQREEPHLLLVSFPDPERGEHHSASAETGEVLSGGFLKACCFSLHVLSLHRHLVPSPTSPQPFRAAPQRPHCLNYVYLGRKPLVRGDIRAGANPPDGLQQWRACMWLG